MSHKFWIVDSFTRERFAGNPAGVVLQEGELSHDDMLRIAGELSLETAFVDRSGVAARVAYYTGVSRVPLCGHDTIALGKVLSDTGAWAEGEPLEIVTDAGALTLARSDDGRVWMSQALPVLGAAVSRETIAGMLGIDAVVIAAYPEPRIVSTGTPMLFVRLLDAAAVDLLRPDMKRLASGLKSLSEHADGIYVWTADDAAENIYSRCFAPGVGLPEDPVTGSASGALGSYITQTTGPRVGQDEYAYCITQGVAMGRPGNAEVRVTWDGEKVTRVRVGGHAVIVAEGTLREQVK